MDEKKRRMPEEQNRVIDLNAARKKRQKEERAEEKRLAKAERPALWKRLLSLVLILALVLSALMLTVYWEDINFDALRRQIAYVGMNQDETGQTKPFPYERGNGNQFGALGKCLVQATGKGVRLYSQSGQILYEKDLQMESPALKIGGSTAVAYDIGGTNLTAFSERGELLDLSFKEGEVIYAASMNRANWMTVTLQKKGQKGCVLVYNDKMEKVFEFQSASRFTTNAYVTEDCKYLVAATLGQKDGTFQSQMVVYRLDQEALYAEFAMEDTMVLAIDSIDGQTLCLGDRSLAIVGSNGQIAAEYTYDLPYLREFSTEGDGFAVLSLNRHRAGNDGKLITVAGDGTVIAERNLSEEILDLSAAGRYIAVLYTDRLVIYNKDLTEYGCFTETKAASMARVRNDGSVWLISEDSAGLLIP